jgi:hypothetical protein
MLQSSLVGHGSGSRPPVLDGSKGRDREAMIKRLNSKNTKKLIRILDSRDKRIWRGTYRTRGAFTRRLSLTLIRIEI